MHAPRTLAALLAAGLLAGLAVFPAYARQATPTPTSEAAGRGHADRQSTHLKGTIKSVDASAKTFVVTRTRKKDSATTDITVAFAGAEVKAKNHEKRVASGKAFSAESVSELAVGQRVRVKGTRVDAAQFTAERVRVVPAAQP